MLETRTDASEAEFKRFIYSNHLQSASLELDGNGDIISYEEYHPYGTTSYQAKSATINATAKRYRYTGKERDDESGLNYHGARYYALWLCRWISVDPLEAKYAPLSSYNYGFNNPIGFNDPSGMGGEDVSIGNSGNAPYTIIHRLYDHQGNLLSGTTTFSDREVEGKPHGTYIFDTRLPNPDRPTVNDGALKNIALLPTTTETYIPNATVAEGSQAPSLWDIYTNLKPAEAGVLNGAWNFGKDAVVGIYDLFVKPDEVVIGLGKLLYATVTMPTIQNGFTGSTQGWELLNAIGSKVNEFQEGDAYKKSSMLTYGALTIGSFFIGGEGNAGKATLLSDAKVEESIALLKSGQDISVRSIQQARQILKAMPELRPHIDKFPGWSWSEAAAEEKFERFHDLWQQPANTYRGDLFPLREADWDAGIIHEARKNPNHQNYPHYNIVFGSVTKEKIKAAIIIK